MAQVRISHATSLVIARESGVLRRWRTSPLPPACFFAGKIIATVILADASAVITVLVAFLAGITVSPAAVAFMLIPITLGVVTWAAIATAVSAFIPNTTAAYPLLTVIYLPVVLLSGAAGQVAAESSWVATLVNYLPARPLIDTVVATLHHPGSWPLFDMRALLVMTGWTLIGLAVALLCFSRQPRPAKAARAIRGSR